MSGDAEAASLWVAVRRYWLYAFLIGLVGGLIAWWAIADYVGGLVVGVGLFGGAILAGWELDPFLPPERRAQKHLKRQSRE